MTSTRSLMITTIILLSAATMFAEPRQAVSPYGFESEIYSSPVAEPKSDGGVALDPLVDGAQHIIDQQCPNGGFGWPHDSCSTTSPGITAPIMLGVLDSLTATAVAPHLQAAESGGDHDLAWTFDNGEPRFGTFTALFLADLGMATGQRRFSNHAAIEFFDALTAGTYGPTDLDTSAWITAIEDGRTGTFINLRSWEFHTLVPAARRLGNAGQDLLFEQAILDGLSILDSSDPGTASHDIIGLAGAVRGLAFAGRTGFPVVSAPLHSGVDGVSSLEELAAVLASMQSPTGSWMWHSNLPAPTVEDADAQTTAYAILALIVADPLTAADYRQVIVEGRDWMLSMQGADGGVTEWPGGPENTEVEGEFLSATVAAAPLVFFDGFESGDSTVWSATVQ